MVAMAAGGVAYLLLQFGSEGDNGQRPVVFMRGCGAHVREDDGGCRDCETCAAAPASATNAAPAIWRAATTFSTACARTGSNDDAG